MSKLLFLDVDGVLNMYGCTSRTFMKPLDNHIEPHIVNRLNFILEKVPELLIVISSSWRSNMEDLRSQLETSGFLYWSRVIGKTPHKSFRGDEILSYLQDNAFRGVYVVVDDEISDICGDLCDLIPKQHVFRTDGNEGMLHRDALEIISYLKLHQ